MRIVFVMNNDSVSFEAIRVFLLIENRLLREALVRIFRKSPYITVVGQRGRTDWTAQDILDSDSDVLVIAPFQANWLPVGPVLEKLGQLGPKVVLIGMDADEEQFMTAVRTGVTGYLLKDASAFDVISAVRSVFHREAVCPPQLCQALFRFVAQATKKDAGPRLASRPELTLRQQQLVALVAKGQTNKEIAAHLNLSEFTVRNHIHRILKQVDAESRSEAVEAIRACGYSIGP
jgi:two-component system, NarL family, nitrate/nitrite response regulator NarL